MYATVQLMNQGLSPNWNSMTVGWRAGNAGRIEDQGKYAAVERRTCSAGEHRLSQPGSRRRQAAAR